jgi:hypothetical protein
MKKEPYNRNHWYQLLQGPFKWFKGCKQKMIKDIFENPLNYV